jgi:RNA polymerase sigma factor (sigma-70 family)
VGRGMSGIATEPRIVAEPAAGDDHHLVAAVRRGDDRAFEALYARYQRRIHAYVLGMVKDHGRAEDVTQEVFVSALRRMRETERPIAFKPWIYEIAKNACIDQFRRSRRTEEISLEADEGFAAGDYGRLVGSDPAPVDAVAAKQELDHLCGAFVSLSDTHHEILVLRELEGLSYREIGDRMGMSRPAVESTLFRARRRLTEEYDELVSGARCQRIHGLIAAAATSSLGTREQRRLSRHVAYCQPCRREALAAGLDAAILTHVPLRRRAAKKIAGLLPFPVFNRWRGGGDQGSAGFMTHAPMLSEQLSGGWGKLATVVAVLVAGVGAAGVGSKVAAGDDPGAPKRAAPQGAAASKGATGAPASKLTTAGAPAKTTTASKRGTQRNGAARGSGSSSGGTSKSPTAVQPSGGGSASAGSGSGSKTPSVTLPTGADPTAPIKNTVDQVGGTVQGATNTVGGTVQGATDTVGGVVQGASGTVGGVTQGATGTVQGATGTVQGATAPVTGTVNQVGQTVQDTTGLPAP